jgi:SAM-dependent methyltransferase
VREYRRRLVTAGQSSPLYLSDVPILWLDKLAQAFGRPLSVLDVGCGLGDQMRRIRERLPHALARVGGVDWSPATVRFHATSGIYDEMLPADSAALPAADQSWDVALSMENLEHLYGQQSIAAIRELARVGRSVIITTPLPGDVVNRPWLNGEIAEAEADPLPLPAQEYTCLESAVHKSALDPASMAEAGFTHVQTTPAHGHYFAMSPQLHVERIRCLGIAEVPAPDGDDHRARYVALLRASLGLGDRLARAWPGRA